MILKENKFFLNAYLAPPPPMKENGFDTTLMEKGYQLLNMGGFTHAIGFYERAGKDDENVTKAIELANQNQIQYIIYNAFSGREYNKALFEKNVDKFLECCSFGMMLFDEPGIKQFDVLEEELEIFNKTGKFCYVNLQSMDSPSYYLENGMWTKPDESAVTDYRMYLEKYIDQFSPKYLSYDFYPFYEGILIKEGYFSQLKMLSEISKEKNIPFYPYIQACSWQNGVRIPTSAEVLWQCGVSLCYGAKGLQYFCFATPYANGEKRKDVAMADFLMQPTERYFAAQKFNLFLKEIEPIIFTMKYKKTISMPTDREEPFFYNGVQIIGKDLILGLYEQDENGENIAIFITNASFLSKNEMFFEINEDFICNSFHFYGKIERKEKKCRIMLNEGESIFLVFTKRRKDERKSCK